MINIKGKTIYGPNVVTSGLVLYLDAANTRSYSPNAYPAPLDIFSYMGSNANAATITRDTAESSPAGGSALKMAITGNDPYTASYASSQFSFTTVASGQAWTVSCWIRASTATTAGFFIFGADNTGNWIEGWNQMFSITTSWQRFSYTYTFSNANTVAMQLRFDGVDSGGSGINVWFDGLQVERNSTATTFNSRYNQNANNWLDLSTRSNNSLLTNGATFTNSNGGAIVFDGTNDWANNGVFPAYSFANGLTIDVVVKFDTLSGAWQRFIDFGNGEAAGNIIFGRFSNSNNVFFECRASTGDVTRIYLSSAAPLTTNEISFYSVTLPAGTPGAPTSGTLLYKNGIQISGSHFNSDFPRIPETITRSNSYIARSNWASDSYLDGNIYQLKIYNRTLTTSEILQNYNSHRKLFGLL